VDHAEDGAEEAGEEAAAAEEEIEVFVDVGFAAADGLEGAIDGAQDDEVCDGNGEEKERGDEGAEDAADVADVVDAMLQREGGSRNGDRPDDDDGRVAEGEHEADGDGTLALLHEFARDVVDGGDVVGVYGVAEAKAVGEEGGSEQDGEAVEGDGCPGPRA